MLWSYTLSFQKKLSSKENAEEGEGESEESVAAKIKVLFLMAHEFSP